VGFDKSNIRTNIDQKFVVRGSVLNLAEPKIMGVLNVTPDSFSDGGIHNSYEEAQSRIEAMAQNGADIIDIGGESTRPGADEVLVQEELDRVLPVLEEALAQFPDLIYSVDTRKYDVAKASLEAGAHIINDVSGLQKEPRLAELCSRYNAGLIIMHAQGTPETMQENPQYQDVVQEIKNFFKKQLTFAEDKGVKSIILDPGFGFGKTDKHNLTLTANIDKFTDLGYPVLLGASRKSTIGRILGDRPVNDRLTGTLILHYHAILKGARILRVHDVKEAKDANIMYNALKQYT